MNFWNIITPFSCAVTACACHMISMTMGKDVAAPFRWLVTGLTIIFAAAFALMGPGHVHLANASGLVFLSIAALVVATLVGVYKKSGLDKKVLWTGLGGIAILLLVWALASCGDGPPPAERRVKKARTPMARTEFNQPYSLQS